MTHQPTSFVRGGLNDYLSSSSLFVTLFLRFGAQELFSEPSIPPAKVTEKADRLDGGAGRANEEGKEGVAERAEGDDDKAAGDEEKEKGSDNGAKTPAPAATAAAAASARIVWDEAALERLLDRSDLEARHAAGAAGEAGGEDELSDGKDDLLKAFKVQFCVK